VSSRLLSEKFEIVCKYKPDVKVTVCLGGVDPEGFSLDPNTAQPFGSNPKTRPSKKNWNIF
jgi:hypothetical protein